MTDHPTTIRHAGAEFPADPRSVPQARHLLTAVLRGWGVDEDTVLAAELVAGEPLTNAIRHGTGRPWTWTCGSTPARYT